MYYYRNIEDIDPSLYIKYWSSSWRVAFCCVIIFSALLCLMYFKDSLTKSLASINIDDSGLGSL